MTWTMQLDQITPLIVSDDEDDERDRPFNAFRFASSDNAKGIIAEAIRLLLNFEELLQATTNKRRPKDQETFDLTVDAILSDLMHHHLAEYPAASTSLARTRCWEQEPLPATRLQQAVPGHPRPHGEAGDGLCRSGCCTSGGRPDRSTVIRPGPTLLSRIERTRSVSTTSTNIPTVRPSS